MYLPPKFNIKKFCIFPHNVERYMQFLQHVKARQEMYT
jgi:hypothetical protein